MTRDKAVYLLILTAIFWSLGGVLVKWIDWHPMAISGMRSAIGAVILWAAFRPLKFTWSRYQIGGAIAYAGNVTLYVIGNKLTAAANVIMLQYTAPVYVALLAGWFLKEKPRRADWIALVVVMGGMALFFMEDLSASGLWGNLAGLGSGISFAWMALLLRRQKEGSPVESIVLGNLLAAAIALPFMFGPMPDAKGWLGLALLGTLQLGLPYALFTIAIRQVTALEALLIPTLEPVLNPVWVMLLLGEIPGPFAIMGGLIIIAAVIGRGLAPVLLKRNQAG